MMMCDSIPLQSTSLKTGIESNHMHALIYKRLMSTAHFQLHASVLY